MPKTANATAPSAIARYRVDAIAEFAHALLARMGVRDDIARDVASILAWCREGPPRSRVDAIDVDEQPPVGEEGFRAAG